MPRPDRHNEIEINLLKSGSLTYLLGGRRTTIGVGRVAAFWAEIPHQIVDFDREDPYYVLTVPLSVFLAAGLDVGIVNRILEGELVVDPTPDPCDVLKFQQWERELLEMDPATEPPAASVPEGSSGEMSRAPNSAPPARSKAALVCRWFFLMMTEELRNSSSDDSV